MPAAASLLALLVASAHAISLYPTDDTYCAISFEGGKAKAPLTNETGNSSTLDVSKNHHAFVQFNAAAQLPGATVTSATLTIYFTTVTKTGNLALCLVTSPWTETFKGSTVPEPDFGEAFATIPAASVVAKKFAVIDVTPEVQAWVSGASSSDHGFAIISPDNLASVQIGAKEGAGSGYPATLQVETAAPGAAPPTNVIPVLGMVWIKPGTFVMGSPASDPDSSSVERPQTTVTLTKGFWMGAHPVTQAEYTAVIGSNPSNFSANPNNPVEEVNWAAANTYCTTLTASESAAGRLPAGWAYRLPTEAEREYCCRAGARTTRFCYGDDSGANTNNPSGGALGNYAWYEANSNLTTQPVEQKLGNAWGLMDMHGNVSEWCQDWYGNYPGGAVIDPQGPATGSARVIRGGAWYEFAQFCRSANRFANAPDEADGATGFRVVLAPSQ
jgi:formylglycine-generating enzyme required for sulfatase activity